MHSSIKRTLSAIVTFALVLSCCSVLAFAEETAPALPTATVTRIVNDDLTFAMNFKADAVTDEQLAYYGKWYADFELTINKDVTFNANSETADGYLSGQYDAWSASWVNVPGEDVTIKANEPLKIMDFASKLMNKEGLKVTYKDIVTSVKDFDCGVYFTPEFLAANPDLQVKLELRMYNPENEAESYTIGNSYNFTIPALPTATVSELDVENLTFALNFLADTPSEEQAYYYNDWYADFELTINKDVTFNANSETADGYLSGQYDAWSANWVNVPGEDVTIKANEPLKIMEFAAKLMNKEGLKVTYKDIVTSVKDFDCGVYFTPEFLAANPDLTVTLELRMYNPEDETESYTIGETYSFENSDNVARNSTTGEIYEDVVTAMREAKAGETVHLIQDVTDAFDVSVYENTTLDLNGYTLTTTYFSAYGDVVDLSEDNAGLLTAQRVMIQQNNAQLPVKTAEGYKFVELLKIQTATLADGRLAFQPVFEADAHALLMQGASVTGVTIQVDVSWTQDGHTRTQQFVYNEAMVNTYLSSYNASTGKYSKMFTLGLNGTENFTDLTTTAVVVSTTGVRASA